MTQAQGEESKCPVGMTRATYFVKAKFADRIQCDMKLSGKHVPGWPSIGSEAYVDGAYQGTITNVKYSDRENQFTIDIFPIQFMSDFCPRKFYTNIRKGWRIVMMYSVPLNRHDELASFFGIERSRITDLTEEAYRMKKAAEKDGHLDGRGTF